RDHASLAKDASYLIESTFLGDERLPGAFAKAAEKSVEIGIVDRAGNGIRLKAQKPKRVPAHFPVSKMTRHQEKRPARHQCTNELAALRQFNIAPPDIRVQFPRNRYHFHQETAEMQIDFADQLVSTRGLQFGECVFQVVIGHQAMPPVQA